jgi:23S rRNA pseudouridine1911/1915/1917 synthase
MADIQEMHDLVADRAERLDQFLARTLPDHSRSKLAKLASEGVVTVDNVAQKPSFSLRAGMKVRLGQPGDNPVHDLTPFDFKLDVPYEDEHLLVVNKPRGMAVHPAASLKEPSLVNALLARSHGLSHMGGDFRPGIVHRLDKDTTGLILIAKNDSVHAKLARQIETKAAQRRYIAVVAGKIELDRFDVSAPIGRSKQNRLLMAVDPSGKNALTHFKVLGRFPFGTVVAAALETGRTHQIRVHLQSIGHPVLGDRLYAPKEYRQTELQLHAVFLAFDHPVTGVMTEVYAPPPIGFMGAETIHLDQIHPF